MTLEQAQKELDRQLHRGVHRPLRVVSLATFQLPGRVVGALASAGLLPPGEDGDAAVTIACSTDRARELVTWLAHASGHHVETETAAHYRAHAAAIRRAIEAAGWIVEGQRVGDTTGRWETIA